MMNERAYSSFYREKYKGNKSDDRGRRRSSGGGRILTYEPDYSGRGRRFEWEDLYRVFQVPLMILGTILSCVLLIVGALA